MRDPVAHRQREIRALAGELAEAQDSAPIALAGVSILPNGDIRTSAMGIELEHVEEMTAALRKLIEKMERFSAGATKAVTIGATALATDLNASVPPHVFLV